MDQLKTFGNNIIEKITGYGADKKIKYTKTYLEYRINKFFEKEKLFKKSWLDLYYNFNRDLNFSFFVRKSLLDTNLPLQDLQLPNKHDLY